MPPPVAYIANAVIKAFKAGDIAEAGRLQRQFGLFPARWMGYGLAPALKASMEIIGLSLGKPYPPFINITGLSVMALITKRHV